MNRDKTKGFTLIELTLAMSFISLLLVAIALTILQISNIYNNGLTLKEVDQVGQSITTELQNAISQSSPFSIATGSGSRYIPESWGGRLCLGQYSYIWNYGKALQTQNATLNQYTSASTAQIHFVKAFDPNATYCTPLANGSYPNIVPTNTIELLTDGDQDLAVQSFAISSPSSAIDVLSNQELYTIQLTLGTNEQSALTYNSNGTISCNAPGTTGADPSYCAVDTFDIVALAGNGVQ